jgi:hypothetical protein
MILIKQLAEPGIPRPLPPGTADEVGQAGLLCVRPVFVYPVALTAQEPGPVIDEGGKGFFGPVEMQHGQRR